MEVMDSTEFEQKSVLVGQQGASGKFKVTNDPMLMSMLSTGLYANPLRTMIQEIMFNAWDAHKFNNCSDRPIDVYLNESTGLIVRDYGPGIAPDQIDEIYCTYGQSTKRQDDNQTGGFGLGSKSPYAYSDSFTVTNHHGDKKWMFIMHRVHDDNDGGPGYTPVIQGVETTETGLMVTVPFKSEQDRRRAYRYMKEILYLSGIKANIHYEGVDPDDEDEDLVDGVELIESESLRPGEFITNPDIQGQGIFAVYGGVKYEIPNRDEYTNEYEFLRKLSRSLGTIYVGFAPNTLTPLPNREGLNMSDRSLESIKSQIETMYEYFMAQIVPATKSILLETLASAKVTGMQPQFIIYKWKRVGDRINLKDVVNLEVDPQTKACERCPETQNQSTWTSLVKLALENTRMVTEMIGYDKLYAMKSLIWAKIYPELKDWRYAVQEKGDLKQQGVETNDRRKWAASLIDIWENLQLVTEQDCKPRVYTNSGSGAWLMLTNIRRAGKTDHLSNSRQKSVIAMLDRKGTLKKPDKPYPDQLWFTKDGNPFQHTMQYGTVIIAKTAAALNDTGFNFQKVMVPNKELTSNYYDEWSYKRWAYNNNIEPIPAFVIHKKKGQYDAAKAFLESRGINVIEADEPVPVVRVPREEMTGDIDDSVQVVPKGPPPMYVVNYLRDDWEGDEEVKKPSTYLYCTKTDLKGYDKPYDKGMVSWVMKYAPKMVMIHNKRKADKLSSQGVLSFEERVDSIVDKLISDKERMRVMYLHDLVKSGSGLPREIMQIPEMQKIMGIPYIRSRQKEIFERDLGFLRRLKERHRYGYNDGVPHHVRKKVTEAFDKVKQDDSVSLVRKMIKHSRAFDKDVIRIMAESMKPGERKVFAQKIARFLRTV